MFPDADSARADSTRADSVLEELAGRQGGVVNLDQVREAGMSDRQVQHRLESRRWIRVAPSVYGFPGHVDSWTRRLWIAHLHAGCDSVICHESAGILHHFSAVPRGLVVVMTGQSRRHGLPGVRRHRIDDLVPADAMTIRGLPVTTPARTIVDLAGRLSPARLKRVIEDVVVAGTVTTDEVAVILDRVRRRGKPGVRRLCDALDVLGPGDGVPRSELERLLDRAIGLSGLPTPTREHPLPASSGLQGFVDRFWPEARLIVEADGRRWHSRRQDIARDHDRDTEAARLGHLTLRLMWERLSHDPSGTADALREVYATRLSP